MGGMRQPNGSGGGGGGGGGGGCGSARSAQRAHREAAVGRASAKAGLGTLQATESRLRGTLRRLSSPLFLPNSDSAPRHPLARTKSSCCSIALNDSSTAAGNPPAGVTVAESQQLRIRVAHKAATTENMRDADTTKRGACDGRIGPKRRPEDLGRSTTRQVHSDADNRGGEKPAYSSSPRARNEGRQAWTELLGDARRSLNTRHRGRSYHWEPGGGGGGG
jgi:hypothetical protein